MSLLAHIAMFTWPLVVVALFAWLPARRAVIVAFLAGWLFLPVAEYPLPGLPDYTKMFATCFGIFLAAAVYEPERFARFRFSTWDLPLLVYCLCPLASSLSNGLGLYDGVSNVFASVVKWGMPYLVGRLYFSNRDDLRELVIGVFIGGLVYVPFCLFELRMSPQLHSMVYGYQQHSFAQTMRFGGWRPTVFMQHGLMVGAWMATASLTGVWLWWTGTVRKVFGWPIGVLVAALFVVTVLCKSTGALLLLFAGLGALLFTQYLRTRLVLCLLLAVSPLYLAVRATGLWDAAEPVTLARSLSEERAQSLEFRIDNENLLAAKARQRWLFGWGGWGRNRVYDDYGNDVSVTDGLWVIELGTKGVVGLASLYAVLLVPCLAWAIRLSPAQVAEPAGAPIALLLVSLALYAIDCLPNGMVNPVMMTASGALVATLLSERMAGSRSSLPSVKEVIAPKVSVRRQPWPAA